MLEFRASALIAWKTQVCSLKKEGDSGEECRYGDGEIPHWLKALVTKQRPEFDPWGPYMVEEENQLP